MKLLWYMCSRKRERILSHRWAALSNRWMEDSKRYLFNSGSWTSAQYYIDGTVQRISYDNGHVFVALIYVAAVEMVDVSFIISYLGHSYMFPITYFHNIYLIKSYQICPYYKTCFFPTQYRLSVKTVIKLIYEYCLRSCSKLISDWNMTVIAYSVSEVGIKTFNIPTIFIKYNKYTEPMLNRASD